MNIVNVKVTEAGLTVTYSDGNKLNHPDTNPKTNEKGAIFSYKTVGKDEHKTTLYAVKLGNVLGKALEVQGINVPNATLIDLPDGYALYERVKQYPVDDSGKAKPTRKDTYLFGNGSKFRSPAEFEDHILWLASDKASSCKCRYCDKDWCQNLSKKSNVFLLDETSNLPLTIQEINPKNKKKFISMYRCEEIVWGDIKYILNPSQYESLFEEVGADQIKYWPALVCKRLKEQYRNGFEILYMLKPLMLSRVKKLSYKFILPWLAYDSSNSTQAIGKELYSDSQIRLLRITKHYELVNAYLKAITRAKEIASTFTALQQYQYTLPSLSFTKIESVSERRLLQQMGTYPHFREILLGNEVLREDDYVRLTRASYNSTDKLPVFRINAIFLNALNKIQLSGDMFIRGPSKYGENWPTLIRMNKERFEYTLDLSEIAGRYYKLHPDIARSMSATIPLPHHERKALIDDVLKHVIYEVSPKKQMAKRSIALPPLSSSNNKKFKTDNNGSISHVVHDNTVASNAFAQNTSQGSNISIISTTSTSSVIPNISSSDIPATFSTSTNSVTSVIPSTSATSNSSIISASSVIPATLTTSTMSDSSVTSNTFTTSTTTSNNITVIVSPTISFLDEFDTEILPIDLNSFI